MTAAEEFYFFISTYLKGFEVPANKRNLES